MPPLKKTIFAFELSLLVSSLIFIKNIGYLLTGKNICINIFVGLIAGALTFCLSLGVVSLKQKQFLKFLFEFHKRYVRTSEIGDLTYYPLLIAFSEELFFRGLLLPHLGFWIANVIFATVHCFVFSNKSVTFISIFIYGSIFSFLTIKTGSLLPAITAHWLFTFLRIYYFPKYIKRNAKLFTVE
jgi:membrane protease YdiL (CAAX protease family)